MLVSPRLDPHSSGASVTIVHGMLYLIAIQLYVRTGKTEGAPRPVVGSRVGEVHREGGQYGEGARAAGAGGERIHGEDEGDEGAPW